MKRHSSSITVLSLIVFLALFWTNTDQAEAVSPKKLPDNNGHYNNPAPLTPVSAEIMNLSTGVIRGIIARNDDYIVASPRKKAPKAAVFSPATVFADETVRVNIFNNDPLLTVAYVIQFVDVITGAIIEERNTGPVQPQSGVVENHDVHNDEVILIIVRGLVDPHGAGFSDDHPVNISSVEIIDELSGVIRLLLPAVQF